MKTSAEIRLENAKALADEVGGRPEMAKRLGMSESQLGQLIGPNPKRNIGPALSRRIEKAMGKERGWLDMEHMRVQAGTLRDMQTPTGSPRFNNQNACTSLIMLLCFTPSTRHTPEPAMPATLTHNEMLNQPKVANLMRWIDSHDRPALTRFVVETGMLVVSSIEIVRGVATEVQETIPATLAAARDLLGY